MTAHPRLLKVADFGLARHAGDARAATYAGDGGPVKWLAPEALDGSFSTARYCRWASHIGAVIDSIAATHSDVWAFGVTLWELATGLKPFADLTGAQVERVARISLNVYILRESLFLVLCDECYYS